MEILGILLTMMFVGAILTELYLQAEEDRRIRVSERINNARIDAYITSMENKFRNEYRNCKH